MTDLNPYADLYWFRCSALLLKVMDDMNLPGYRECAESPRLVFGEAEDVHLHGVPLPVATAVAAEIDAAADPPMPQLPAGEYARVEIMGHDDHTGWVSDGERAGVKVLVVRDWDGHTIAEVPGQSLYRFVPLPTPLRRPSSDRPRLALPPSRDPWDEHDLRDDDPWQP
jgi:hypothetical protein